MKSKITSKKFISIKINNKKGAIQYLTELAFSDLSYHLDEDAEGVDWGNIEVTKKDCIMLDKRNEECRKILHNDIFDFYYPIVMESIGEDISSPPNNN